MGIREDLIFYGKLIKSYIYPDRCVFCDRVVDHGISVCKKCRKTVPVIKGARCFGCGKPKDKCKCAGRRRFYDGVAAPFMYSGVVQTGVKLWKYGGRHKNTEFFGKAMKRVIDANYKNIDFDFICYVPQTEKEKEKRGYNQSRALADELSMLTGIPVKGALCKVFETRRQHDLPWYLKSGNVLGVFECIDAQGVKGKNILIADDIKTSGCTLGECAKVLKLSGAEKVYCVVIAVR